MKTEISERADFSGIRYAQCWEDADVLLDALDPKPEHTCVSIASAGDNTLALVARGPRKVIAIDLSPAQLACLALRVAAFRTLSHAELLGLIGSRPCADRWALYQRCRPFLSSGERAFWDERKLLVEAGIGSAGKFERYFALFRNRVLPLVHSSSRVQRLLAGGNFAERIEFYERTWNTFRWRMMFRLFFSRFVMARAGRDPAFFRYVDGDVAGRILDRTRYALVDLNPAENPYLQWILCGTHRSALPFSLRPENFESIRKNLDCLEWRQQSLDDLLAGKEAHKPPGAAPNERGTQRTWPPPASLLCASSSKDIRFDRFNLSDIFEYMSADNFEALLKSIASRSNPGTRLAYWNMLVPRSRPDSMGNRIAPLADRSKELFKRDKAWFYSAFVLEEVI